MKQELSPEHRIALVQYRFERAWLTLKEADYMRRGDFSSITQLLIAFIMPAFMQPPVC